jgi:HlyD family secretion protein
MVEAKQSRFDSRLLWIPAVLLLILVFFSVRHWTRPVLRVRVGHAERQSLTKNISTNGKVEPQKDWGAHAPGPGTIKALYVHAGQTVHAGELLLSMDDADALSRVASALASLKGAQANLDAMRQGGTQEEQLSLGDNLSKAKADLADAQRNLNTLQKLQAQGAASPSEVTAAQQRLDAAKITLDGLENRKTRRYANVDMQHAEATLAEAKANYAAAQAVVAESNVRAPFAGTVYSLPVSQTEYVQQGQTLIQVADLSKLQVRAYFDEPEIGNLKVGQAATIVWDAKHGQSWKGHVERLPSTIINYNTRNVGETLISIDDTDGTLLPNVNVTVTVTTEHLDNVLTIPREALHTEAGADYVYVVSGDSVHRRPVTIGSLNLTQVQITSGLNEGDVVATGTANGDQITEGVPIRLVQ